MLVWSPRAARHDDFLVATERFHEIERLHLRGNGFHTIETSVAANGNLFDANTIQQFFGFFCLHKEMRSLLQLLGKPATRGLEKMLVFTENGTYIIKRYSFLMQLLHEVIPKFIFHKDGCRGLHDVKELSCIMGQIQRQIEIIISNRFFNCLRVTRRREECYKYLFIRLFLLDFLNKRLGLLIFP